MTYLFKQCFRYVYDIHVACTASIQLLFMHSFLQLADNEGNTSNPQRPVAESLPT